MINWFLKKDPIREFQFKCSCCNQIHKGMPSLRSNEPLAFYSIPREEIDKRVEISSDMCVIDDKYFFVLGCLEFPVIGYDEPFSYNAWVSLSENNFQLFIERFEMKKRDHFEPMFGWLNSSLWPYYDGDQNIKTRIHFRNNGIRPFIELDPTDHKLARAQSDGIRPSKVIEMYEYYVHGKQV